MSVLVDRLGPGLRGAVALDMFAGSGALGLEALSRGASRVVLVEKDRAALQVIAANVASLGVTDRVAVVPTDALGSALKRAEKLGPYALLFCDPPYRIDQAKVARALESLGRSGAVASGAAVAWEHSAGGAVPEPAGFAPERTYRYGDTAITLLRFYGED
jgi:16S rRNA (guanine966-N2)-methyltransferase